MTLPPTPSPEAAALPTADHLLDALPLGLLVLGAGGIVQRLNQQAAAWWGLAQAVVQGQPVASLAPASLPVLLHEALQQLAAGAELPAATFFVPARQQWLTQTSARQAGHTLVYWQDVTAQQLSGNQYQHLAEDALRQSEEKYRTLFETMDQGFAVCELVRDAAGQPTDWYYLELNPAWERQTGLPRATALHQLASQVLPSLDRWWHQLYGRVVDTGEPARFEHYANALGRWYQVTAYPQGGERFAVLYDDITARKQTEQQLQALTTSLEQQVAERTHALQGSNDLLQSMYDTNPFAMSVLRAVRDETGTITDFRIDIANLELARATQRLDLVGKLYLAEFPGLRAVGLFEVMLHVLETGEPASLEYYYGQDGFDLWCASMFVRLGDGLVASNLDISARKRADEELRKNLGLLRQSEQLAGLGNWDYELHTGIFTWSAGMYRLFGLPPGSLVSPQTYLDFVVPEDRPIAERLVHHLRAGSSGFEKTLRIGVAGQVKTLRLKALMQYDEQGEPLRMLGVDLDISAVQRLEQENLHMRLGQQRARMAAVLEAQEEERRRIAESLHNGLGQMLYATKLQLDQLTQAPQLATTPALAAAHREATRLLSEVIQQVRILSHELTPGIVAEFGLAAALHDICSSLSSPQLRWQCLVHLDAEQPLALPLQVAVYRLTQEVAQNIVKHAHATQATLEVETLPGWLVVRAEDNGQGFESTATTTGIGLKTLRHRVALLGGTVHLSSVPQRGTQLQLRIPLANTLAS
ncbi:MAG: PAS domain-containing protein [Janthinobacterium lividum]